MINELTRSQLARIPEFVEKWYRIAHSTQPADRDTAQEAVRLLYVDAGLEPPAEFLWMDSPLQGARTSVTSYKFVWVNDTFEWPDYDADEGPLHQLFTPYLLNFLAREIGGRVQTPQASCPQGELLCNDPSLRVVRDFDDNPALEETEELTVVNWSQISDDQMHGRSHKLLLPDEELSEGVWNQIGSDLMEEGLKFPTRCGCGQHNTDLAMLDYLVEICGISCSQALRGAFLLAQSCGFWWPYKNHVLMTERPRLLRLDPQGRPHCETGPALQYPDGWDVWAWHGAFSARQEYERPDEKGIYRLPKGTRAYSQYCSVNGQRDELEFEAS
jgi:hypothetical protein